MRIRFNILVIILSIFPFVFINGQIKSIPKSIVPLSSQSFQNAKPWVVWYFKHPSYSREGIKADLEAMAANNITGAYFTPIKDKTHPWLFAAATVTLTPEWCVMFRYLATVTKKINIQVAMFPNDGFATASGPCITPEKAMQNIVWTDTVFCSAGKSIRVVVPQSQ